MAHTILDARSLAFNLPSRETIRTPAPRRGTRMERVRWYAHPCDELLAESLRTSATDFIEVNQTFGSPRFGLYFPLAIARARARICCCDMIPITILFTLTPLLHE
jgi:hypothetical protein